MVYNGYSILYQGLELIKVGLRAHRCHQGLPALGQHKSVERVLDAAACLVAGCRGHLDLSFCVQRCAQCRIARSEHQHAAVLLKSLPELLFAGVNKGGEGGLEQLAHKALLHLQPGQTHIQGQVALALGKDFLCVGHVYLIQVAIAVLPAVDAVPPVGVAAPCILSGRRCSLGGLCLFKTFQKAVACKEARRHKQQRGKAEYFFHCELYIFCANIIKSRGAEKYCETYRKFASNCYICLDLCDL